MDLVSWNRTARLVSNISWSSPALFNLPTPTAPGKLYTAEEILQQQITLSTLHQETEEKDPDQQSRSQTALRGLLTTLPLFFAMQLEYVIFFSLGQVLSCCLLINMALPYFFKFSL